MLPSDSSFKGNERFTIRRCLGAGGMGVVYEAYDTLYKQPVALKTLARAAAAALYRLKSEFRSLADIAHPNLVSLFELFIESDACFFTMELIDGEDFVSYCSDAPPPEGLIANATGGSSSENETLGVDTHPLGKYFKMGAPLGGSNALVACRTAPAQPCPAKLDRASAALLQLAEGLCALHNAGKLHCDIKPSNILVTREGRVVILDFGLAIETKYAATVAAYGLSGTPGYIAPEQTAEGALSPASDWYAVGVTLYQILTGRLPFTGSVIGIANQQQAGEPVPPSHLVTGVPNELEDLCLSMLCREPAARPSGAEILGRLKARDKSHPSVSVSRIRSSFVGREASLARLEKAFQAAKHGATVRVYVHGGSGMGKSALAWNFLRQLQAREQIVLLAGRCYERESIPYKALDGVVDNLAQYLTSLPAARTEALLPRNVGALAKMFPVLGRVEAIANYRSAGQIAPDPLSLRRRAFAAFQELLGRVAERLPLVLFIDDFHWSDSDSITLLEHLLRPPEAPALLLITTFRNEEAQSSVSSRFLRADPGDANSVDLPLDSLNADEAARLARLLMAGEKAVTEEFIATLVLESRGNPFLIEQLTRWAATPAATQANHTSVSEMLEANIRQLPEGARAILETLSVAAHPVPAEIALRASGLRDDARPLVTYLRSTNFLSSTETVHPLELYHDRIREFVTSLLTPAQTQLVHQRLAEALIAIGFDDPEILFEHYFGAANFELAARYAALAAAKASAALAFDRAAAFYSSALELAPPDSDPVQLKSDLGHALANAGRPAEAASAYLEAAQGTTATQALELQRRAAEQLLLGGHVDEGLAVIRTVLDAVGLRLAAGTRTALVSLLLRRMQLRLRGMRFRERQKDELSAEQLLHIDLCWAVAAGLAMVDNIRGADFQTRHLLLALQAGEPYRIARALAVEAGFSATSGASGQRRAERFSKLAETMSARVGHPHATGITKLTAGIAKFLVGQWKQSFHLCEEANEILRDQCTGVLWELTSAQNFSLGSLLYLGELREVAQRLPAMLQTASERGNLYATTEIKTRMNFMWLVADDPGAAQAQLAEGLTQWSHEGFHRQHYNALLAEAQIHLYVGNGPEAWKCVTESWPALRRAFLLKIQVLRLEAFFLRGRCALMMAEQHPPRAPEFLEEARRQARAIEREHMAWADPLAWLLSAGIAALRCDPDGAARLLCQATDGFTRAGMALHRAVAQCRLGGLRRDADAHATFTEAVRWMTAETIRSPERISHTIAPGFH